MQSFYFSRLTAFTMPYTTQNAVHSTDSTYDIATDTLSSPNIRATPFLNIKISPSRIETGIDSILNLRGTTPFFPAAFAGDRDSRQYNGSYPAIRYPAAPRRAFHG